ncbi:MAG: adenosylcobinamide-phosphate synthase CbiB [Thermodesulfobacteriota bacterium]
MDIATFAVLLFAAYVLDMVFGDPAVLPHPVRWIGRGIALMETFLRGGVELGMSEGASSSRGPRNRVLGVLLALFIAGGAYLLARVALIFFYWVSPLLFYLLSLYLIWMSLSIGSLASETRAVLSAMKDGGLGPGRQRLSRIVGRDTAELSEADIYRAAAETVAENTSDGVVAPLFYLAIGGPPLMLAYKAVNTLDSMVGYKNERYRDFGWFSARLDDAANFIPARLSAAIMVISAGLLGYDWRGALRTVLRDGGNHTSPNAGLPEAAVAGAIGLSFGGPGTYGGRPVVKPLIGEGLAVHGPGTVTAAIRILSLTAFTALFVTCLLRFFIYGLF